MSTPQHIIAASQVEFAYVADRPILRGVNLEAEAGKFICILGPNGSGKTTLLRCLLGQLCAEAGEVVLDGKRIGRYSPRKLARLLAYVPQSPDMAFDFCAYELVLMGRFAYTGALGLAGKKDRDVATQAMIMTDTLEFADRKLDQLSGGEAQCVMIARALTQQPAVMLMDEPTSHLDIKNQLKIYRMMQRLAHEWEMAVICVSHDVNLASRFADKLVMMRDGCVIADGTASEVVNKDILAQTYDLEVDLIPVPGQAVPIVWSK